jgi:hypothetical protein
LQYDEVYFIWVLDLLFVQSNISGSGSRNQGSEVCKEEYGADAEEAGRSSKKCAKQSEGWSKYKRQLRS